MNVHEFTTAKGRELALLGSIETHKAAIATMEGRLAEVRLELEGLVIRLHEVPVPGTLDDNVSDFDSVKDLLHYCADELGMSFEARQELLDSAQVLLHDENSGVGPMKEHSTFVVWIEVVKPEDVEED